MNKDSTMKTVILFGTVVSSLIALIIICTAAYIAITQRTGELPNFIGNWGGLIIGFYFGTFVSFIKDWIGIQQMEKAKETIDLSKNNDSTEVSGNKENSPIGVENLGAKGDTNGNQEGKMSE